MRKLKVKFKVKPKSTMGDYIALNWKTPRIPKKFHIKKNEIWIRTDYWKSPMKRKRIKTHEKIELNLMNKGLSYKKAHKIANKFEKNIKL